MKSLVILAVIILPLLLSCEREEQEMNEILPGENEVPINGFTSFSTNGQTLPTAIHSSDRIIKFEIDHNVDPTTLVPEFSVPSGYKVLVNGIEQISGKSSVDFTQPVKYIVKDQYLNSATWEATAVQLSRKILIDASHDGGVWWFPQYEGTGFDQDKPHQGQAFANLLRQKGFKVDEIGRGKELNEEMCFGYYIVIRAGGFQPYTLKELDVYTKLVNRGMNLVFFTDHKKYDPVDELGDHLGLQFKGIANGKVTYLKPNVITSNMTSLDYIAGSVLTGYEENKNIEILGSLGDSEYGDLNFNGMRDTGEPYSPAVMGILTTEKSKIFFIGDMNGLQVMPQPFIDNLIKWMGVCF